MSITTAGGKTLTFIQGNTHEGMKWTIIDKATRLPVDITGATVAVLIQSIDGSTTIINRNATQITPTAGTCKLVPLVTEMDIIGEYIVQLTVTFPDTTIGIIQDMYIKINSVRVV